jgi:hypothetical protein
MMQRAEGGIELPKRLGRAFGSLQPLQKSLIIE